MQLRGKVCTVRTGAFRLYSLLRSVLEWVRVRVYVSVCVLLMFATKLNSS